jgi:hypothetical protein
LPKVFPASWKLAATGAVFETDGPFNRVKSIERSKSGHRKWEFSQDFSKYFRQERKMNLQSEASKYISDCWLWSCVRVNPG